MKLSLLPSRFRRLALYLIFLTVLAVFARTAVQGQLAAPPGTNLFGDEIVRKIETLPGKRFGDVPPPSDDEAKAMEAKAVGYTQVLIFQNERQLRGEIVSLSKDEVVWRRPDASAPIRFPRSAVRRMILAKQDPPPPTPPFQFGAPEPKPPPGPIKATVKLSGADWLFGDLASSDGQNFTLRIDAKTSFNIPRTAIEWLYFDEQPAPAFSFSGRAADLTSWLEIPNAPDMQMEGETAVFPDNHIFEGISRTRRLEASIEVPENSENGTLLQLFPSANVGGGGSDQIDIHFGSSDVAVDISTQGTEQGRVKLPEATAAGHGPARYRALYDDPGNRLVIMRNGRRILDLKLRNESAANAEATARMRHGVVRFMAQRTSERKPAPLKFNEFRVEPWDGVLPKEGEQAADGDEAFAGDRLSSDTETLAEGKLESVGSGALRFSGVEKPLHTGMMVRLQKPVATAEDADGELVFGKGGRVSLNDLRMEDGRVRWRGAVTPSAPLTIEALQIVSLPWAASPAPTDLLVFKDGDELGGRLLAAAQNGPLGWRMPNGQVIEFQPGRVAGIRFLRGDKSEVKAAPATLELRNGDRFRAEITSLDAKNLGIKHPLLGAVTVERGRLWRLQQNSPLIEFRGGEGEEILSGIRLESYPNQVQAASGRQPWILFDGAVLERDGIWGFSVHDERPADPAAHGMFNSYEIHFDLTQIDGGSPEFDFSCRTKENNEISGSYSHGELTLYPRINNRIHARRIRVEDQIPTSRIAVGLLINPSSGNVELFLNGNSVAQIGRLAGESRTGVGAHDYFYPSAATLSNVWVGPRGGETPNTGGKPQTTLGNGDSVSGEISGLSADGKLAIQSEAGRLDVALEKVQSIDFGGAPAPLHTAARIRLADGSALNVDGFRFDGHELTAQSGWLGEIRLPSSAVSELIIDPGLPRFPHPFVETQAAAGK